MAMGIGRILKEFHQLAFPPRCQICGRFCQTLICQTCHESLPRIGPPLCESCGHPFDPNSLAGPVCGVCRAQKRRVYRARSFGRHEGALRTAVNALKFGGKERLARPLGQLLASLVSDPEHWAAWNVDPPSHVIPVPLHPARRALRGFDQAELLAEEVGITSGVPVRTGFLLRVRDTPPQIALTGAQRAQNVRGAFALRHPFPSEGHRVLLIDDVYTTGATLEECARALQGGGAGEICAITLTRRTLD